MACELRVNSMLLDFMHRLSNFFSNPGFMPHIHCYLSKQPLVWTMLITDLLIGLAYAGISATLWVLVRRTKVTFSLIILCFGIFIGACGGTHFMEVWTLWHPDYWIAAIVKAVTAIASVGTGIYLFRLRQPIITLAEAAKVAGERGLKLEKQALDLIEVNRALQREIKERKIIENELRRSEEQLRITIQGVKDYAIFMLDPTGHIVSWNEGAERIKQYRVDDIIGKHFSIFYTEEDQKTEKPARELREAIIAGCVENEGWLVRKDRTRFWANVVITAVKDSKTKELKGFFQIVRDMTEKKRASDELQRANETLEKTVEERTAAFRESESSFRSLTNTIPQLVWTAYADGHVYWYNQRWYNYTGTTSEEMAGWGWQSVHDPHQLPRVLTEWRHALETKEPFEQTFPLRSASGKYRWFLTRTIPIKDERGRVLRWIGTNTDVTDLREAREASENAMRLKSRFLDIAAHELRTPVTAFSILLQFSQMQLEKGRPVDASTLAKLRAQADRLSRLVVDLLDVSRLERGKLDLKLEPTDIASLVSECIDNFKLQSPKREFVFLQPAHPVELTIDPIRVYQVISNLIDNGLKYTPEHEPIEITLEAKPNIVTVTIKDHGVGIPEAQVKALFQPFVRGVTQLEESTSGLGLGLFISKNIINLHGGTMKVTSEAGHGSTFTFELPRKAG